MIDYTSEEFRDALHRTIVKVGNIAISQHETLSEMQKQIELLKDHQISVVVIQRLEELRKEIDDDSKEIKELIFGYNNDGDKKRT